MSKTPRLSWFKFFPSDWANSVRVRMMKPAARGIYHDMLVHCWLNVAQGCGIPNSDEFIQSISNATAEEWQSVKTQVLQNFEVRDNFLYNKRLCEEMDSAIKKSEITRKAANKKWGRDTDADGDADGDADAPQMQMQMETYIDTDVTHMRSHPISSSQSSVEISIPVAPPPAVSSPAVSPEPGEPASVEPAVVVAGGKPQSNGIARSNGNPTASGKVNQDVQRLRATCVERGGKLPNISDVERLLGKYSVEEIEKALIDYSDQEDEEFIEYKFFVDGGAEAIIETRRKNASRPKVSARTSPEELAALFKQQETIERAFPEAATIIRTE